MEVGKQITSEALELYKVIIITKKEVEEVVLFTGNRNMDPIISLRWTLTALAQQFELDI